MATSAEFQTSIDNNILSGGRRTSADKVRTVLELVKTSFFNKDDNPTKGLSTNDFTTDLKNKLDAIANNATSNVELVQYVAIMDVNVITLSEIYSNFTGAISIASGGTGIYRLISAANEFVTGKVVVMLSANENVGYTVDYNSSSEIVVTIYDPSTDAPANSMFNRGRLTITKYPSV